MIKVKFDFDDSGFRELQRKLEQLAATKEVSLGELLDRRFMTRYTPYADIDEMVRESGVVIESIDDAKGLSQNDTWNRFIAEKTRFSNWHEMLQAAAMEYTKRKLGLK